MEQIYNSTWFWVLLIIIACMIFWYLRPFFVASFSRTKSSLWGYRLGLSKKNKVEGSGLTATEQEAKIKSFIDEEIQRIDERAEKENERLEKKIGAYDEQIKNFEESHKKRKESLNKSAPSTSYESIKENISKQDNLKGFALFFVTLAIIALDTKVASDIFKSFGTFLGETSIWGYKADTTLVYGFLFTFALATFLHIVLAKTNVDEAFGKDVKGKVTFGAIVGFSVIFVILLLRIIMLAAPDQSTLLAELLLLAIWIVCILLVCFIAKYIGQNDSWISAIGYPALFVLLILFGGVTIIGYLAEFLVSFFIERKLRMQKSRTEKLIDINETSKESQKMAFIRGVTS